MQTEDYLHRNIKLIYSLNFVKGLMFFLPIFALYLQQELFTVFNVTLVMSIEAIARLILEVPTGAIADLFGRKKTLILSSFVYTLALVFLSIGGHMAFFIIYALLSAFSSSLLSGTDEALLFDTIKAIKGKKPNFKKAVGINMSMWPIGASISSIIGSFLAVFSYQLPIALTIIPFSLAFVMSFFLVEPKYKKVKHTNIFLHMSRSTKLIIRNKQILVLLSTMFVFFAFGEVAHQLDPIFFQFKGISIMYFGIVYTAMFGMSFFGSFISHKVSNKIGNKKTIVLSAISPFLLLGATFVSGFLAVVFIVLSSMFHGLRWPVISHMINIEVKSENRATMLSICSLVCNLGFAVFAPIFGILVGIYNVNITFRIIAMLCFVAPLFLLFLKEKN